MNISPKYTTMDLSPSPPNNTAERKAPKSGKEAAQLLIAAQNDYFEASRKHLALLKDGIQQRDRLIELAGCGFPRSYKDTSISPQKKKERMSAEQLAVLETKVVAARAVWEALKGI